jgi:hypothetical protein
MILQLKKMANLFGIYGTKKDTMPERMSFLHPDAAASFLAMDLPSLRLRVSDVFRSPESSLAAVQAGRGAQMPSYSGHNYGFSVDLDVDYLIKKGRFGSKEALDTFMEKNGWFCHRRDHKLAFECWHFNYGIGSFIKKGEATTAAAIERKIVATYGAQFKLTNKDAQAALKKLGLYSGEVDGKIGPISLESVKAFQRCWGLDKHPRSKAEYGTIGPVTQRTLAYCSSDRAVL